MCSNFEFSHPQPWGWTHGSSKKCFSRCVNYQEKKKEMLKLLRTNHYDLRFVAVIQSFKKIETRPTTALSLHFANYCWSIVELSLWPIMSRRKSATGREKEDYFSPPPYYPPSQNYYDRKKIKSAVYSAPQNNKTRQDSVRLNFKSPTGALYSLWVSREKLLKRRFRFGRRGVKICSSLGQVRRGFRWLLNPPPLWRLLSSFPETQIEKFLNLGHVRRRRFKLIFV